MAITGVAVVPLNEWPERQETRNQQRASFKANWFATESLLVRECNMAGARNIKLYTFHSGRDIRQDGWVRGDARRPRRSGVILEFEKRIRGSAAFERLRFPCDTFNQWEDNVRAIALALEALRRVDRYGVVTGAQYAGYKALPPAEAGTQGQTPEQAAEFIANSAGRDGVVFGPMLLVDADLAEFLFKQAAKRLHPDSGGTQESFARLENSISLLRDNFKKKAGGNG